MEIVTSQLSTKLCIEDIDAADGDNPQLCAEYVKEIYEYMMMLEVMPLSGWGLGGLIGSSALYRGGDKRHKCLLLINC